MNNKFEQWFEAHKALVEEGVDSRVDPEQIKAISEQCFLAGQRQAAERCVEILGEECGTRAAIAPRNVIRLEFGL